MPKRVVAAVERTAAEFGGIDILVNNAGIGVHGAASTTFGWKISIAPWR